MQRYLLNLLLLLAAIQSVSGSENVLTTIYQPLDPMVDGSVVVREVPFVTSGAFPEVFFYAITRPHIPQQVTQAKEGDINVASRAGVSISCKSAAAGQKKLYIVWDFSKADPKLTNKELIEALLVCLEKTAGKRIGLYSQFVGAERYPAIMAQILARIPEQTAQQFRADNPKQRAEQGGARQPATAPNSKSEGNKKPKSESEVRSQ